MATIETDLGKILEQLDRRLDRMEEKADRTGEDLNRKVDNLARDMNGKVDTLVRDISYKMDELAKDVSSLKVGQARLEEKLAAMAEDVAEMEGTQKAQIWALIAILGTAVAGMAIWLIVTAAPAVNPPT